MRKFVLKSSSTQHILNFMFAWPTQFGEYNCVFVIKLKVPNVIQRIYHMQNCCSGISQLAFCLSLVLFDIINNLSRCLFAARSAIQLDDCKYVFAIKWNVSKAIQRMHHMVIYCFDLSQLSLCLPSFFFTLSTILRDAYWRSGLRYSLVSTNVHL